MNSQHSFKRLSPTYVGAHLPKELRQRFEAFWHNIPCRYEPRGWVWDFGSGFFHCELIVCNLDSELETTGYLAVQPLSEEKPCRINCVLDDKKFDADAEVVRSKIFDSMSEAKAFWIQYLHSRLQKFPHPFSGIEPVNWRKHIIIRAGGYRNRLVGSLAPKALKNLRDS